MDFSESLSMFTDSLYQPPTFDFNVDDLFTNLLSEDESENIVESLDIVEPEENLVCVEVLSTEEDEVIEAVESTTILKKEIKKKLKRRHSTKVDEISRKAMKLRASSKCHQGVVDMITMVYETLPSSFTLHSSFLKITKIQKLDQIHKFVLNAKNNGHKADK